MSKNITIKEFNGNQFEELFPKTMSSQIIDLSSHINSYGFLKLIEIREYWGTGQLGPSNPNMLTFTFQPKFVLISCEIARAEDYTSPYARAYGITLFIWRKKLIPINGIESSKDSATQGMWSCNTVSYSENTMSWYCNLTDESRSSYQLNRRNGLFDQYCGPYKYWAFR